MTTLVATATATFNPQQYVPASIENDYQTGLSYYTEFSGAAQGVSVVNGSVQLSDAATEKVYTAMLTTFEATVPILGTALAIFMSVMPQAGAGPGVCATSPPPPGPPPNYIPTQSLLQQWPHYQPWTSSYPAYDPGAPDSFELYANGALQFNWELFANCYSGSIIAPAVLLATLIASWNATHEGPQRTISRSGLNPAGFGLGPNYDPIAYALENAVIGGAAVASSASPPQTESWAQAEAENAAAPHNVTSSFSINDGAFIQPVKVIKLKLGPAPAPATPAAASPLALSSGSKVAITVAIAGGSAAAGVGVWAYITKQAYGQAWSRLVKKVLL